MIKKTCLGSNCPESFSICCHAPCRIESNNTKEHFVCSRCGRSFQGGLCNAKVPTYSRGEILKSLKEDAMLEEAVASAELAKIPTDTSYIGGVNFDPDIRPIWEDRFDKRFGRMNVEGGTYPPSWFIPDYIKQGELKAFIAELLTTQKAEVISLIMGMETKDKGRESDEFDAGAEIMRAKIINTIRAKI